MVPQNKTSIRHFVFMQEEYVSKTGIPLLKTNISFTVARKLANRFFHSNSNLAWFGNEFKASVLLFILLKKISPDIFKTGSMQY